MLLRLLPSMAGNMQRLVQWNVLIILVVNLNARFHPPVVPIDSEGYVKSFTFSSYDSPEAFDARTFFEEFGFVVIANVFTPEQCADTISDLWNVIESFVGIPLWHNEDLWTPENWMYTGFPKMGFLGNASFWTRQILLNRQTPALHAAFAAVLGTNHLLVNHDRYGMLRPAKEHPERATLTNLHLDMNPWRYTIDQSNSHQTTVLTKLSYTHDADWIFENNEPGCAEVGERHVQGVVNLADNRAEDGGFWLVPGFHKYLPEWTIENTKLGRMYGMDRTFIFLHPNDFPQFYADAQHISARAGSVILWDQRTVHGTLANRSLRPRFAQFVKMFPAESPAMTADRAKARATAILKKLLTANIDPETDLTRLGKELFGLDN